MAYVAEELQLVTATAAGQRGEDGAAEPLTGDPQEDESKDPRRCAARAGAWCRVAVSFLGVAGPLLARPQKDEAERPLVPLLQQAVLDARVPVILGNTVEGPQWARVVLEKLVSVLDGVVSKMPGPTLRAAVAIVSKFFLQNLTVLQRHERFDQLWLMVLRLLMLFIKQGTDSKDAEVEEIATETLKNILCILINA